jgi:hypothetical protein
MPIGELMKACAALLLATLVLVPPSARAETPRQLPSGPPGPGRFGAYQTTLKFDPAWDKPWRIGDAADVVVRFDDGSHRFVFWHGTSYIPHWVTDNGIWFNNEFLERKANSSGLKGCIEPMSDKQCRYSHVRVLENNDARAVVHWRYAPVDVEYRHPFADENTGWGDWVDEVFTIYPDGTAIRQATLHTTKPDEFSEWHEAIIINQPGTRPEDNIEPVAVSLANMDGESRDYQWPRPKDRHGDFADMPKDPCIQVVNLKSPKKPFSIVDPRGLKITVFRGHAPGSIFHHWDHWPVSQDKSWSRTATSAEKPSHSSLFNLRDWPEYARTENSITRLQMQGLTEKSAADLAPLARSWLTPPPIEVAGKEFTAAGYEAPERAYRIVKQDPAAAAPLAVTIQADPGHPAVNPAFVIAGWGDSGVNLQIDGRVVERGPAFRYGHRATLDGTDLVIWVALETDKETVLTLTPHTISEQNNQALRP